MIKKKCEYPIMQLMLSGFEDIEEGLSVTKLTDLKGQFKTDFEFIKTSKLTDNDDINASMSTLIELCVTKYKSAKRKLNHLNAKFVSIICSPNI